LDAEKRSSSKQALRQFNPPLFVFLGAWPLKGKRPIFGTLIS
jgi:hypothetical protein